MKLVFQYTSEEDKKYIKEAAKLENYDDAKEKGWNYMGCGVYKSAYRKGNIVVKFSLSADSNHLLNEVNFYRKAKRKHKEHLARIFGGDDKKIIQKLVKFNINHNYTKKEIKRMDKLSEELHIYDLAPGSNIVFSEEKKKLIFYDFAGHVL